MSKPPCPVREGATSLVAVAMSPALAHALELPRKLRLNRENYTAVQAIYYPGFTIGEGVGMVATFILLIKARTESAAFWCTLAGLSALAGEHGAYWVFTHPVNRFWLKDEPLTGLGRGFFAFDPMKRTGPEPTASDAAWTRASDRWEFSHVLRAILAGTALTALVVAVAI